MHLRRQLADSLALRVLNVPPPAPDAAASGARIAVLFSGGLDCSVLARLASDLVPPEQTIDLLNVAFENPRVALHRKADATETIYEACPDRITGRKSFAELAATCPSRRWRFVAVRHSLCPHAAFSSDADLSRSTSPTPRRKPTGVK